MGTGDGLNPACDTDPDPTLGTLAPAHLIRVALVGGGDVAWRAQSRTPRFQRSYLLRRAVGDEVEFITIILFDSLDDVRAIAGEDYERAVIPADRLPLLTRYDARAAHYEVIATVDRARA